MTPGTYKILCPLLALALMLGLAAESFSRARPVDAEPFHEHIRKLAEQIPVRIGDWSGKDIEVYQSATKLLNPNFILQRMYVNETRKISATLLIVQCKDARDMGGHYPRNCYPAQGYVLIDEKNNKWTLRDGSEVSGKTYRFANKREGMDEIIAVNSVMMVPDKGYADSIEKVRASAASLSTRFFGAAQIQVVMSDRIRPEDRDSITTELLQANQFIIDALLVTKFNGGAQ